MITTLQVVTPSSWIWLFRFTRIQNYSRAICFLFSHQCGPPLQSWLRFARTILLILGNLSPSRDPFHPTKRIHLTINFISNYKYKSIDYGYKRIFRKEKIFCSIFDYTLDVDVISEIVYNWYKYLTVQQFHSCSNEKFNNLIYSLRILILILIRRFLLY